MVGIIILNFNTFDDTCECIKSIRETTHISYKIYVVDNVSSDGSYKNLIDKFDGETDVTILKSDRNGGYSYGNNIGARVAISDGCDYILISNPDVIYFDRAIDLLAEAISKNSKIGVVGPSTPSLDQSESQLLRKVFTPKLYFFSKKPFKLLSKFFKSLQTEIPYPQNQDEIYLFNGMVRGCCFMISTNLFNEIGLFDDNVFLYSEEWIIAKKIYEKGLMCAFIKNAKALHKEATSTKKLGTGFQTFHLYLSAFYYLKHYTSASNLYLKFVCVQNKINFFIKSLFDKSYKQLFIKFKISQNNLSDGKKNILIDSVR